MVIRGSRASRVLVEGAVGQLKSLERFAGPQADEFSLDGLHGGRRDAIEKHVLDVEDGLAALLWFRGILHL